MKAKRLGVNHKGEACDIQPVTCQEGFCEDCQIYQDFKGHERTMGRRLWTVGKDNIDNEICQFCGVSRTALKEMITEGGKENLTMVNTILQNCPACAKALGGKG